MFSRLAEAQLFLIKLHDLVVFGTGSNMYGSIRMPTFCPKSQTKDLLPFGYKCDSYAGSAEELGDVMHVVCSITKVDDEQGSRISTLEARYSKSTAQKRGCQKSCCSALRQHHRLSRQNHFSPRQVVLMPHS